VRSLEGLEHGQHRGGLGLVAFERVDHQRESGAVGEQPDRDLGFEAAFLGEPGLAEPVTGVGLEVQGGHLVQHQGGRTQRRVLRAGGRELGPPRWGRIDRQPPLECGVRGRRHSRLGKHPGAVDLAGGLDDPRQHQLPEHLITAGGLLEPEHPIGMVERVDEGRHPRTSDRQRSASRIAPLPQVQVQHSLPSRKPLPRNGLQQLQLDLVMRGPDMLHRP
jgi:hypothetical protein